VLTNSLDAQFRNQMVSKATGVENQGKISHFFTTRKIEGRDGWINYWVFRVSPRTQRL